MENLSSSAAQPLNLPSAEGRRRTEMCMILFLKVIAAINVLALAGVCAYLAIEGLPVISWSFLTEPPKNMMTEGGIFPCIIWRMANHSSAVTPCGSFRAYAAKRAVQTKRHSSDA